MTAAADLPHVGCDSCGAMREAVAIVDFRDGSDFLFLVCEPCSRVASDRPGVNVVWLEDVR